MSAQGRRRPHNAPFRVLITETRPTSLTRPRGDQMSHARIQPPSARATSQTRRTPARGELSGHQWGFLLALDTALLGGPPKTPLSLSYNRSEFSDSLSP